MVGAPTIAPGPYGAPGSHGEPPAVVALLAGRPDRDGFRATLLDLAARGWFRLRQPGVLIGWDAMQLAGPVMCLLATPQPTGNLLSYERRAAAYLVRRADERGEVPADALAGGFAGGERRFMRSFRREVAADARQRGLTRPAFGRRDRLTPAGQAAFAAWRTDIPPGPAVHIGRDVAYAAALGAAPLALFAHRRVHPIGWHGIRERVVCRVRLPRFAEFDGQVLSQWEVDRGSAAGIAQYVAIHDGVRARTFAIASHVFEMLTPGAFVHAQVDPRRNKLLRVQPLVLPVALTGPGSAGAPRPRP